MRFKVAEDVLLDGVQRGAFPAVSAEVGTRDGVRWRTGLGRLTYHPGALETDPDTIFDLASLTKVIATTTLVMRAIDDGLLRLEDRVADWIDEWRGRDREHVTLHDLLLLAQIDVMDQLAIQRCAQFTAVQCDLIPVPFLGFVDLLLWRDGPVDSAGQF